MKRISSYRLMTVIVAALFAGGCATTPSNVLGQGSIPIQTVPNGGAKIVNPSAKHLAGEFVIKGQVERMFPSPIQGHVDLAVYTKGGELFRKASVRYFPGASKGRGKNRASFTARLPSDHSEAGTIRVAYHGKPGPALGTADCGENAAERKM